MHFQVHTQVYVDKVSQEKELLQPGHQQRRAQAHNQSLTASKMRYRCLPGACREGK